ncbi:MAG: creatininase family protein [Verrucomicrobiota bacterium]
MDSPRLANIDPGSDWTRLSTRAFADAARRSGALAVLPVFGIGDHGLGLPLDIEEVLGAEIVRRACAALRTAGGAPLVLPPLRLGPAPYPAQRFGIDPDLGLDWLGEVADGVRRGGFSRLAFVTSSPWHREWIDTAALDIHAAHGLQVFKLHLADIGLTLHPAAAMSDRAVVQAAGAALLGVAPEPVATGEQSDVDFRPGRFARPSPVDQAALPAGFDAGLWLGGVGARCAKLLGEAGGLAVDVDNAPASGAPWRPYGERYLPGLTPRAWSALGDLRGATAILPVSAVEQHGPHLPLGVDAMLGEGLLQAALRRLPADAPVWVAPPLNVGKSVEHRDFAGTLSVSSRTLRALLTSQVGELHALGFGTVAIWNTHGGNSAVLNYTVRELQALPGLRVGRLESGFKPELDPQEAAFGFHAGRWETALMLALAPELVDRPAAVCDYPARLDGPGVLRPERAAITHAWMTSALSSSGVMGDATAATLAEGAAWLESAADGLADAIGRLVKK